MKQVKYRNSNILRIPQQSSKIRLTYPSSTVLIKCYDGDKDFIPVCTIPQLSPNSEQYFTESYVRNHISNSSSIIAKFNEIKDAVQYPISRLLSMDYWMVDRPDYIVPKEAVFERAKEYVSENIIYHSLMYSADTYRMSAEDVLTHIQSPSSDTYVGLVGSTCVVTCNGFLVKLENVQGHDRPQATVLASLMLKPGYLREYKLRQLLGKPMLSEMFELHVDSKFKAKAGYLHGQLRRNYFPKLTEKEINIVEVEDLTKEVFSILEIPKMKTLSGYKDWLAGIATKFVTYQKEKVAEREREVERKRQEIIQKKKEAAIARTEKAKADFASITSLQDPLIVINPYQSAYSTWVNRSEAEIGNANREVQWHTERNHGLQWSSRERYEVAQEVINRLRAEAAEQSPVVEEGPPSATPPEVRTIPYATSYTDLHGDVWLNESEFERWVNIEVENPFRCPSGVCWQNEARYREVILGQTTNSPIQAPRASMEPFPWELFEENETTSPTPGYIDPDGDLWESREAYEAALEIRENEDDYNDDEDEYNRQPHEEDEEEPIEESRELSYEEMYEQAESLFNGSTSDGVDDIPF